MKAKLITVIDEMTHMDFLVVKFDSSSEEEYRILSHAGWEVTPELTLLVRLGHRAEVTMSTFEHPRYDIHERGNLEPDATIEALVQILREVNSEDLEKISVLNVKDRRIKNAKERLLQEKVH